MSDGRADRPSQDDDDEGGRSTGLSRRRHSEAPAGSPETSASSGGESSTSTSAHPPEEDSARRTPPGNAASDPDTPSRRRNKRKMTEPRRRPNTDFSIRSICSSSNSDRDDDDDDQGSIGHDAKIWKPSDGVGLFALTSGSVDERPGSTTSGLHGRLGPLPTTTTREFSFYPLNIPTVYRTVPIVVAGPLHAATAPVGVRPPSVGPDDSLDGSVVDQDRSSGGGAGRASSAGRRRAASSSSGASDDSPTSSLSAAAAASTTTVGRQTSTGRISGDASGGSGRPISPRKNYKNMTKQRRIEANARERTRVHTISAAFESLRRAVPSYSYNQRLSKLAILRIACSYILALARLADLDYSAGATDDDDAAAAAAAAEKGDRKQLSFAECVDLCTQTIQAEGKAKRRH